MVYCVIDRAHIYPEVIMYTMAHINVYNLFYRH